MGITIMTTTEITIIITMGITITAEQRRSEQKTFGGFTLILAIFLGFCNRNGYIWGFEAENLLKGRTRKISFTGERACLIKTFVPIIVKFRSAWRILSLNYEWVLSSAWALCS